MAGGAGETFLGLDIGTSSIKALLIDAEQRTVADASVPLSLSRPPTSSPAPSAPAKAASGSTGFSARPPLRAASPFLARG